MMSMESIRFENWASFENFIDSEFLWGKETKKKNKYAYISSLLFRGHSQEKWKLETTLERYIKKINCPKKIFKWEDYHSVLTAINSKISAYTGKDFDIKNFHEPPSLFHEPPSLVVPPSYEFMVYLRHHGFPSPLLDWTKSPYIAAFFAFKDAEEDSDVAIYCYREYVGNGKSGYVYDTARITGLGPYVKTHIRHFQQQCEYTICSKKVKNHEQASNEYCPHEEAEFNEDQDFIRKFALPGKLKKTVLEKLDLMNINDHSLFGSEESLMSTLAYKEIERRF